MRERRAETKCMFYKLWTNQGTLTYMPHGLEQMQAKAEQPWSVRLVLMKSQWWTASLTTTLNQKNTDIHSIIQSCVQYLFDTRISNQSVLSVRQVYPHVSGGRLAPELHLRQGKTRTCTSHKVLRKCLMPGTVESTCRLIMNLIGLSPRVKIKVELTD